jgi:antitoxin component YwqK of YwqJK toxin-antitoxin module
VRAFGVVPLLALASCLTQHTDVNAAAEPKLEVVREKDRDGHLVREQMVLAAKGAKPLAHGSDKGWYSDGAKRYEREFDHGVPKGVWRTWHANGQIASETTFGETESVLRFWYDTGVVSAEGPALNGSRRGVWRFNRPDGSLRETGKFVDSVRDGTWTAWNPDGRETSVRYVKGSIVDRVD